MKKLKFIFTILVATAIFASCDWDNYDEPESFLKGTIVYNGEPINVSYNDVNFQLWEPGWELSYPIDVVIDQDGSYSALLFNGNYKLVFPDGQGPFRTIGADTLDITVNGDKNLDIEVEPYYMIRNAQFSATGGNVTATFQAEKIITDADARDIERVNLYVNKSQFVDFRTNIAKTEIGGGDIADANSISMSVAVPEITPTQNYVYARVGLKVTGREDMIFSPVQRIDL
ncbi:DUF3823 domain-containing protein [Draconibacterium sediminis]|uniref:DUF3823 domain-containing protein n=1 Tax=Draconibacterium sediminis TaxID=1544798 RepID=A0A0D8JEC0_9BACT|nr:DUF3823 domain-containing protein [Draconibacterium sediminis]KJF45237.1 hypothetical protein LH29_07595 [Draconibacterium sediminis]